ncbi:unannotated protein [freshwater metagenome]|uniref:Unannotated protein n=1 Tax=freshwater metagenome TaxID=449393 RepID=A0A6J7S1K4_9ZZZZ
MLTSNPKLDGKIHTEPAPDTQPFGELNAGRWFKKVATPLVRSLY